MAVDGKQPSTQDLQQSIKNNFYDFLFMFVVSHLIILAGGFAFLYIEHCSTETLVTSLFTTTPTLTILTSEDLTNGTTESPTNCSLLLNELRQIHNKTNNSTTLLNSLLKKNDDGGTQGFQRTCKFNPTNIFIWFEYSMTVATTIG